MATVFEIMGLAPVGSTSPGATDPRKEKEAYRAGTIAMETLRRGITPRQIATRTAFENAIAAAAGTGGSTNSVLHLHCDRARCGRSTRDRRFRYDQPKDADHRILRPGGKYVALDVDAAGGMQLIAKRMLEGNLVTG